MKDPYELVKENEGELNEFIEWQINVEITNEFSRFAKHSAKAQDVFKYAAILFPEFLLVENCVVMKDHYSENSWESLREKRSAKESANFINHVHIEDYLTNDFSGTQKLQDGLGNLLAFFWLMAVKQQYPKNRVVVDYDGDAINILNQ